MTAPVTVECRFELARYPFWVARGPVKSSRPLADRGPDKAPVVAVRNPQKPDYRIKIWWQNPAAETAVLQLNGQTVHLQDRGAGLQQGHVDGTVLQRILDFDPDAPDLVDLPPDSLYLDGCIETRFDPGHTDRHGRWLGDTRDFPEWMGADCIAVQPPQTGGQWHDIALRAAGLRGGRRLPLLRVNGVWCWVYPIGNRPDWHTLLCDPQDLDLVRGYGAEGGAAEMENAPVPPRTRQQIRLLHLAVHLSRTEYFAWTADVQRLQECVMGMAGAQGQVDVNQGIARNCIAQATHAEKLIQARYRRRPAARRAQQYEQWYVGSDDPRVEAWRTTMHARREDARAVNARIERMQNHIATARRVYADALTRCEDREHQYADPIAEMYADV